MYQKIMVPLDGSKLAESVLSHVMAIAGGCGVQNIVFVRVVEPAQIPTTEEGVVLTLEQLEEINRKSEGAARGYLKQIISQMKLKGVNLQSVVIRGKPSESIVDYANGNNIDLIVIATHGRSGISRWVWGSVADRILRYTCVPVLMIRVPGCIFGTQTGN